MLTLLTGFHPNHLKLPSQFIQVLNIPQTTLERGLYASQTKCLQHGNMHIKKKKKLTHEFNKVTWANLDLNPSSCHIRRLTSPSSRAFIYNTEYLSFRFVVRALEANYINRAQFSVNGCSKDTSYYFISIYVILSASLISISPDITLVIWTHMLILHIMLLEIRHLVCVGGWIDSNWVLWAKSHNDFLNLFTSILLPNKFLPPFTVCIE